MAQSRGKLDLAEEAFAAQRFGDIGAEDLYRDLASVLAIVGEVDGGHTALAELAIEAVAVGEGIGEGVEVSHGTKMRSRCVNAKRAVPTLTELTTGAPRARSGRQAVASLHQQLDCIRQVLLRNMMVPALAPKAVSLDEHVSVAKSVGRLELVTRKLDRQSVCIFEVDRIHETAVALIE